MLNVKPDSAFYYFNKVATSASDSLLIARAYNRMAAIQSDAGDYFGSQETLLASLKYLDEQKEKDFYCLSADYNELGGTSLSLKNYDAALDYYNHTLKFTKDSGFKQICLNNKALVYQKKRDYPRAIEIYDSIIININKGKNDKKEYARVLSNRARTKWLQDSAYQAGPELLTALQIRKDSQDYWGQNASYAHLSDYYAHVHPDSALIYANKMYAIARHLNSPDDELEALQKLMLLGPPQQFQQYFTRYQYLSDSIQTARNTAKNQFALIRYDAEKNKAENLKLQKENSEKRVQIIKQYVVIGGVIGLMIFAAIVAAGWYRKRKQQLEWETQNRIREHQLKTSQKVHDVVANGLYRIMTEVEYQPEIEKESLLDKIDLMYKRSRNISYELSEPSAEDFQTEITRLLKSFATDTTKVSTVVKDEIHWDRMKDQAKREVEYILQELMVNMRKHSSASNVVIRFEQSGNQASIHYADDGVGLPSEYSPGNGLTNTGNRIRNINGKITFDTNLKKGLKIQISFPIS